MTIRTLLIEDDFKARRNLQILLEEYCPNIKVVGEAENLDEAVSSFESLMPDLIFLDMHLGSDMGFDLFDRIDLKRCKVIVASAFEDFALKAFRFSAIDYLVKPIKPDLLVGATQKVEKELMEKDTVNRINTILSSISAESNVPSSHRVGIPTVFGSTFIDYNKIIRCEADRNYTRIYMAQGKPIMSSKNLLEIEQMLPKSIFVRVHHSHLINMNHMEEYHKGKQGFVIMSDKSSVQISQNRKSHFIKRLS